MLYYDREAACYDATRGGDARASAAADAIEGLLPPAAARIADAGCGTGIVTARLRRPGRYVVGVDQSAGMAAIAATRLPGRVALGDVTRLPLASGSADVVTMVWLLHLLSPDDSAAALAEAGRVLAPGGMLVTTVAKDDAPYVDTDDAAAIVRPFRSWFGHDQSDGLARVLEIGSRCGLSLAAQATFTGLGQGRSPRDWREQLLAGKRTWAAPIGQREIDALCAALAALPDQERRRPDPVYQLAALRKEPVPTGQCATVPGGPSPRRRAGSHPGWRPAGGNDGCPR
jgi:SAM-dependent methyltransferase